MTRVLVDSSIWISYFRYKNRFQILDDLITSNQICLNDLVLAELLPYLHTSKNDEVIEALLSIEKIDLQIDWEIIINLQITNLKNGINKVGIPDLIILENVLDNNLLLFSEDKHFELMSNIYNFKMFKNE